MFIKNNKWRSKTNFSDLHFVLTNEIGFELQDTFLYSCCHVCCRNVFFTFWNANFDTNQNASRKRCGFWLDFYDISKRFSMHVKKYNAKSSFYSIFTIARVLFYEKYKKVVCSKGIEKRCMHKIMNNRLSILCTTLPKTQKSFQSKSPPPQ